MTDPAAAEVAFEDAREDAVERGPFVGFVGCPKLGVLKVRVASKTVTRMEVACPACGEIHFTPKPMVRAIASGELVTLIAEGVPMEVDAPDPDDPTALHGRQSVTDAAILAAVPVGRDVAAAGVAWLAGYEGDSPTNSFTRRLERMNARAEKEGEPPPFVVTPGAPGKASMVRQIEREKAAA
jgi:hypothetical protein